MVRLHKYFFEVDSYDIEEQRQGNTQRSRTGKIFTDYTSDAYRTFSLTIDNLTEKEHYNLIYITSRVFPTDGQGLDIEFTDPYGDSYTAVSYTHLTLPTIYSV